MGYKYKDPNVAHTRTILLAIYIISVLGAQYSFNSQVTQEICGSVQTTTAFFMTIIPNILMFGLLIIIFNFFPGWKAPFSNTFGYIAARIGGVRRIFLDMMETGKGKNKLIEDVYEHPEIMINEITPANFDTFMDELSRNNAIGKGSEKYFSKLYKLVTLKDCMSELLWYAGIGTVVISVAYNGITELSCTKNTDQMMATHIQWAKEQNTATPAPTPKIYYTRE